MIPKTTYTIDGSRFATLEEFYQEISDILIPDAYWGHNLDAFNDILRGGFGTPDEGFILVWRNASLSKERLGYPETVRQLQKRLERSYSTNRKGVLADIAQAKREEGPTVFDWLIEIIEYYAPSQSSTDYAIELILV